MRWSWADDLALRNAYNIDIDARFFPLFASFEVDSSKSS
jgi:hypothetical protein